jgi:hypothetical protein
VFLKELMQPPCLFARLSLRRDHVFEFAEQDVLRSAPFLYSASLGVDRIFLQLDGDRELRRLAR